MLEMDISELIRGTAEAAFAVTTDGIIRLWNPAAEEFFGVPAAAAVGCKCCELICGQSASNMPVCLPQCSVLERAAQGQPAPAFDLQVRTANGRRWINVSVLIAPIRNSKLVLHLARDIQHTKIMEEITRGFLRQLGAISGLKLEELLSPGAVPHLDLSLQETAILRLLVEGKSTKAIGEAFHISPATVRNHIEHILQKLSVHSRLEAVLRAIREKLV
jgi:PAS domain S-box-containing protein